MIALRILALAAAMLAVAAPAATAGSKGRDDASAMIDRINAVRADNGLPALKEAPKLARSSGRYARRLLKVDAFGHGSSYKGAGFRLAGEILASSRGWSLRPSPILRMWLNSPGHRAVILNGSFRYVGASPARGRLGRALTTIWVVHFGAH